MISSKESPLFYGFSFIVVLGIEFDKNIIPLRIVSFIWYKCKYYYATTKTRRKIEKRKHDFEGK